MIPQNKIFYLFIILFQLSACMEVPNDKLMIATAANMQFAMEELVKAFEVESGIPCEIILGSSGKLTAQIKEGAPFDLFVSANMKYPNDLHKSGLTISPPIVYAYGKLVLWSMDKNSHLSIKSLNQTQYIALANPKTAPYGEAAEQVLQHYNLLSELKEKLVYGESIAQTNQFIISEAAEVGFTAKSVVLSPLAQNKGAWIDINADIYTPIKQGIVVLKKDEQVLDAAHKFQDFLSSSKAKEILRTFGYEVIE